MKRLKKVEGDQLPNPSWCLEFGSWLPQARV